MPQNSQPQTSRPQSRQGDRTLALRPKAEDDKSSLVREYEATQQFTERDFYSVQGKRRPSARLTIEIAKYDKRISTEILEIGKDKEKAWCKVRAWIAEDESRIYRDAAVIHYYEHLLLDAVFDAITNGINVPTGETEYRFGKERAVTEKIQPTYEISADGWPVITDITVQLQLMKNHLQKITFAERDAHTKAEIRALTRVLGMKEDGEGDDSEFSPENESPVITKQQSPQPQPQAQKKEPPKKADGPPETLGDIFTAIRGHFKLCASLDNTFDPSVFLRDVGKVQYLGDMKDMDAARELLARIAAVETKLKQKPTETPTVEAELASEEIARVEDEIFGDTTVTDID